MLSSLSSYFSFCGGERRLEPPPGQAQPTQARQGAASLGALAQGRPVFPSRDSRASQDSVSRQDSVSSLFEEDDSPSERLQPQAQATNLWPSPHATKTPQQAERRPDMPPAAGPRHQAVHIAESQAPVAQATRSAPAAQVMRDDAQRQASSSNRADECCNVCCKNCDALIRCICCR